MLVLIGSGTAQDKLVVSYPASAEITARCGPPKSWYLRQVRLERRYRDDPRIGGGIQALLSDSTQIIQGDPASPILAASRGAEIAIIAQPLSTFPFAFLSQKEIRKPSDLVGKNIAILDFRRFRTGC